MTKLTNKMAARMYPETPEFTKVGKARVRSYHAALGRFIDRFARIETAMALTLWRYAGTREEVARIVFAGVGVENCSRFIEQIADATTVDTAKRADLGYIMRQFRLINGTRNKIIHHGASSVAGGNAVVSNAERAKGPPTILPISAETLDAMTEDLRKIWIHLHQNHLDRPPPLSPANVARIRAVLRQPWRYKHPQSPQGESS
jgi:hypothetical protein